MGGPGSGRKKGTTNKTGGQRTAKGKNVKMNTSTRKEIVNGKMTKVKVTRPKYNQG